MDGDIADFECPVCNEYMNPPIRMCQTGHCFCNDCFEKIERCCLCQSAKSKSRCFVLERIYEKIKFPCKFSGNGCTGTFNKLDMKKHVTECHWRSISCPIGKCKWNGKISNLESHCLQNHKDYKSNPTILFLLMLVAFLTYALMKTT